MPNDHNDTCDIEWNTKAGAEYLTIDVWKV